MNRKELYAAVQDKINREHYSYGYYRKMPYARAKQFTEAVLDTLCEMIRDNDSVYINRFGTFKHATRKGRRVIIPGSGKEMVTEDKEFIKFVQAVNFGENLDPPEEE